MKKCLPTRVIVFIPIDNIDNTAGLVKLISQAKCSVKTREASREANTLHYQISLSYMLGARSDL